HHQRDTGIEFVTQNLRRAVTEDVAEDAAEYASGNARHHHHDGVVTQFQGDIAANHGEGHQPDGVQYQKQLVQVAHEAGNGDSDQATGDGHVDVARVLGPGHGKVTQQDVPNGAATEGGQEGYQGHAEQIHVPAPGVQRSGYGLCGNRNYIDRGQDAGLLRFCDVSSCP